MSELDHIEEYTYYEIGRYHDNIWYLDDLEEALNCVQKNIERRSKYRSYGATIIDITSDVTKDIAAKYLKNHQGYQRVSREKIHLIKRVHHDEESAPEYIIRYNDSQIYKLK